MEARKIFMAALMGVCLMGTNNIYAQNNRERNKVQNPEQRIEMMANRMQQRLMLDEETANKFTPLYKEYITELQNCRFKPDTKIKRKDMTDKQIREQLENKLEAQRKSIEVKEKYLDKFDDILTAKQLETVFTNERKPVQKNMKPQMCSSDCPKKKAGNCPKANK